MTRQQILDGVAIFIFALRLRSAIERKVITPDSIAADLHIVTRVEGSGITLHQEPYSHEDMLGQAYNLVIAGLGASAIVIDDLLDAHFGSKNPSDTSEVGSVRAIFYMIRCAFAHGMSSPEWECRGKYQRAYTLTLPTAGTVTFDGAQLHGQPVKFEDIGGLEAYLDMIQLIMSWAQ